MIDLIAAWIVGIWIVILIGASLIGGFAFVTASWSRTVAHGGALRESVREVRRGTK